MCLHAIWWWNPQVPVWQIQSGSLEVTDHLFWAPTHIKHAVPPTLSAWPPQISSSLALVFMKRSICLTEIVISVVIENVFKLCVSFPRDKAIKQQVWIQNAYITTFVFLIIYCIHSIIQFNKRCEMNWLTIMKTKSRHENLFSSLKHQRCHYTRANQEYNIQYMPEWTWWK